MAAITAAGTGEDESAIPELIRMLESTDPGARLLAIRSLERLTGQTLGYDYAAPRWARSAAVERWKTWAPTRPAPEGAPGVPDE
jgi:HEAT repeat protein